jgi:hypothetical protein
MNAIPPLRDLDRLADRLRQPREAIERVCSGVADRLAVTIPLLGGLTETFETVGATLDQEALRRSGEELTGIAATLERLSAMDGEERATLVRVAERTREVITVVSRMRETVGAIGVLAVNARIEAAHVRNDTVDFSVFTTEIARLAQASRATIERFENGLKELAVLLGEAVERRETMEGRREDSLGGIAEKLAASVRSVAEHRVRAADTAAALGGRMREASRSVGDLVNALQIGDITRQRMEHVEEALRLLIQESDDPALDPDSRKVLAATVCRLQSAQLSQTRSQFETELGRIADGLRALAGEAEAIRGTGLTFAEGSTTAGSFLDELDRDLQRAASLLHDSREARDVLDRVAGKVAESLAALVGQVNAVNAIEAEMRLVGLNTALKCGRIGTEGRALDVIAQELRAYANVIVERADAVKDGIHDVDRLVAGMRRVRDEDATRRLGSFDRTMERSVGILHGAAEAVGQALGALDRDGRRIAAVLGEALDLVRGADALRVLREAVDEVGRIAGSAPVADADVAALRERLMKEARRGYTMASERLIHDLLDGYDPNAAVQPKGDEALEDILF